MCVYECTLKLIIDSFAFPVCPQCNFLLFNKGQRDGAMQRGRRMSMHAKSNLLQAPSETPSPTVSADPKCISLHGPDSQPTATHPSDPEPTHSAHQRHSESGLIM